MRNRTGRWFVFSLVCMMLTITVFELDAQARAGGGRSTGSRGSRSYSRPLAPSAPTSPMQSAPQARPYSPPYQQPSGGGFFRSMAGGIVGGMLGGMLFRSLGFGGMGGGMGGSGIGLFEILLIAGIGYFIYRMVKRKREEAEVYQQPAGSYDIPMAAAATGMGPADLETGLAHIRQMDYSFDPQRFKDEVMDTFFRIQGAWMNRDLSSVTGQLTDEMRRNLQADVDTMLREKRVNRLENIAVRSVEPVEAWQEAGQDYITTLIYANLLDYTTEDGTGAVVAGSKTEPVKFEEYWTFTRSVGANPWRLSAIEQK